ncbi:hypothetical protein CH330_06480 [candidate division WOR-3 bacterium JGI_Cruoil_03_51_56]|uniref:Uncharacterized protein n=1 Tax=candidate division WOR-3 bacterium JGI_Cruoil_03_51_56 TaxID=1973747 RepID=A0A235BSI3_UNCW3|nr:MAG: hypothetical protein CH330_06480 [candidate division WOR-3 bacterium JGI_Cruoil_03_51_56]
MPVIFLKSGGTVTCGGYTIKNGVIKAIGPKFENTSLPKEKSTPAETDIPLLNILFVIPGKL